MDTETNENKCYGTGRCCRGKHWGLTVLFCIIFACLGFFAGKMSDCRKSTGYHSPQYFHGHHGYSCGGRYVKQKGYCNKKIKGQKVLIEKKK